LPDAAAGLVFGNLAGQVFSLDAQQQIRWQTKLPGAITTTPLRFGRTILLSSSVGLFALDKHTGAIVWRHLMTPHAPTELWDSLNPDPQLVGDQVLIALGREVALLDAATGQKIWQQSLVQAITATPRVGAGFADLAGELGRIVRLDLRRGAVLWQHDIASDMIQSQPQRSGDALIFAARDGKIRSWSVSQRKTRWEVDHGTSWVMASALLDREQVLIGSSDSYLVQSIDRRTGRIAWQVPTAGQNIFRSAIKVHNQYWFATGDAYAPSLPGQLLAINRQGQLTQTITLAAAAFGQLVGAKNTFWIGAENGVLYAIGVD
jgi:outer membrane protein assembly factor BamB